MERKMDLHIHTVFSDGTDTLGELAKKVREMGFSLFSVTDHDSVRAGIEMPSLMQPGDPAFVTGVEFSCKDEKGKYHVLGYGYDPQAPSIQEAIRRGHDLRMDKLASRLSFLKERFGFEFSREDVEELEQLSNPGKPHIGMLMVRRGYASSKDEAIEKYINLNKSGEAFITPEEAIEAVLQAGGIPVLAHPSFGNGSQMITGSEMEERLVRLMGYGLEGVEAFYSGFDRTLTEEILTFASRFSLYVTAGSDYHGSNKTVSLGETGFDPAKGMPEGMKRFLDRIQGTLT